MSDIISQLAKEMNLSQRTIYRALHNPAATTRAAVARRAEEICSRAAMLGYRTNVAARSIRNGNFKQMLFVTARCPATLRCLPNCCCSADAACCWRSC